MLLVRKYAFRCFGRVQARCAWSGHELYETVGDVHTLRAPLRRVSGNHGDLFVIRNLFLLYQIAVLV